MKNSPVIIMGMHRSGTTLIAGMLQKMGIFLGKNLDVNQESTYFQKINKWLLSLAGAAWDNPDTFDLVLKNEILLNDIHDRLNRSFTGVYAFGYFGLMAAVRKASMMSITIPWGWKDPRNTFTLPIFTTHFPDAKIIHVYRHGVDVAQSLKTREDRILTTGMNRNLQNFKQMIAISIPVIRGGILSSVICQDRQNAFDLWVKYMSRAKEHEIRYSGQIMSVRYESLLENPIDGVEDIRRFIRIPLADRTRLDIHSSINNNRAYAYQNNPELLQFAEDNSDALRRFGY